MIDHLLQKAHCVGSQLNVIISPTKIKLKSTMVVEEVNLLRNGSCWNNWQNVSDQQVNFLPVLGLSDSQTYSLTVFSVTSSSVDKWWVESVYVIVFAQECETSNQMVNTFSDGDISAVIGFEVLFEFIELWIAILESDDTFFRENNGLGPLK